MRYFITGGTGSFGSHYAERLLEAGHGVTVYSRDELKQHEMAKAFPEARYIVGDVRDESRVTEAMRGHDYVIHAAALKHVRTGELHPGEAVQTNIIGSWNVAKACVANNILRAVILSTDKAVMPVNTYGSTKYVAEKMWLGMNDRALIFTATRYGNVMGSRGSVLHVFNTQKHGGRYTITDKRMTRFAVTFDYAMDLVERAIYAEAGAMIVSKVKPFRIVDLAMAFSDAPMDEVGIGAGEKIHEMMLTEYERSRAVDMGTHYLLPPDKDGYTPTLGEPYTSGQGPFLTVEELQEVILASIRDS